MTTYNHTAISSGAAANASTVNSPLGEIDAAIGDKTTLTTTEKGTIVGAINEQQTVLKNIPMSNMAYDPYNMITTPELSWLSPTLETRTRWVGAGQLSLVDPDASNPFGAHTVRMGTGGDSAGREIWFDECGIKNGDTVTFWVYAYSSGGNFSLDVKTMTIAGVAVATTEGTHTAFSGSAQKLVTTVTITSTAARAQFLLKRNSGSTSLDVYHWGVVMGTRSNPQFAPGRMPEWHSVPASASADGIKGMKSRDDAYIYYCVAADTWERVAIASW